MKIGLFGVIYTLVYFFLAITSMGGGHGTFIFFAPLLTWILILPAFFLLARMNKRSVYKVVFVVLMLTHYAQILIFLRPLFSLHIDAGTQKTWDYSPETFFITGAWYVGGQVLIWLFFFKSIRNRETLT